MSDAFPQKQLFIALSFKNDSFSGVTSAILRVGSCSVVYLGLDLIFACVQVFEIFNGHLLKVALDKHLANDFIYVILFIFHHSPLNKNILIPKYVDEENKPLRYNIMYPKSLN